MWSRFWYCSDTAGPGLLDVARAWDRKPRILRPENRRLPGAWQEYAQPVQLTGRHAGQVAAFWKSEYGGSDWWLDADEEWVRTLLSSRGILALGVFQKDSENLLGTIVSRPTMQQNAYILMGENTFLHDSRVIEGLCIHHDWRAQHLAGWLIAWIDYWTHERNPTAHFWFREVGLQTLPTTEVARATWVYVKIAELPVSPLSLTSVPLHEFSQMWERSTPIWRHANGIVASLPDWGEDMSYWEIWKWETSIVVLLNTRRKTRDENEIIWEVAWCGEIRGTFLRPGLPDARPLLEAAARQKGREDGLLFGTDEPHHGGASATWSLPWKFGKSGMQLSYIYNYMPPAFWQCDVQMLRTEI